MENLSIYEKLAIIQQELKAPKGQYNDFGKYKYRSCEDILEALKPLLKEQKLSLILGDELVFIGQRYYIKATAKLINLSNNETIENDAYAREEENVKGMSQSQITGTASSYARKYALNGLFNIDDTKDADTNEYNQQQMEKPITENQLEYIEDNATEEQIQKIYKKFKVKELGELNVKQASQTIKSLKALEG